MSPRIPRAPHTRPRRRRADETPDPAPLSARQLRALTAAIARELSWGLPSVAREVRRWRALAAAIPDPPIRHDALSAITEQRGHIDGAALFSILPGKRHLSLLCLLVAYEVIWDYLDNVNERSAARGIANGLQLHLALADAVDVRQPPHDYCRHSPGCQDNGYLRALVTACQAHYARLPSSARVRRPVIAEAIRGQVCAINHDPDPASRDATLQAWAATEFPAGHEACWFELTAAASTNLTVFALLALAAEPAFPAGHLTRVSLAYYPWISLLTAMLDSYVDEAEDAAIGNHSYIAHYATPEHAAERTCRSIRRCVQEARSLPHGEKHTVIAACMFDMYLSKDSALTPGSRATTARMIDAGGTLTRLLHPVLRLWRTAYRLRSA